MSNHSVEDPMDNQYQHFDTVDDPELGNVPHVEVSAVDEDLDDRELTPIPEDASHFNHNFNTESAEAYDGGGESTHAASDYRPPEEELPAACAQENSTVKTYELVVNSTPIDLDTLYSNYAGLALIQRLEFVIDHCPPLRRDATILLINHLRATTHNVSKYTVLCSKLDSMVTDDFESTQYPVPVFDREWVDDTTSKATAQYETQMAEFKRQKDEGVKESTRRAMEGLFQHYISVGNVGDASRLYSRGIRDYCTQFKHTIQTWKNWIDAAIFSEDWQKVDFLNQYLQRSLREQEEQTKAATGQRSSQPPERASALTSRQQVEEANARLCASQALLRLQQGKYRQAAEKILELSGGEHLATWFTSVADLGAYATLCCMATFSRSELKKKVVNEGAFRKLLESEPMCVEMLQTFIKSQFGRSLDIMHQLQDSLLLDPFVSSKVKQLYTMIRERAIQQYLEPYNVVRISTMAEALRCSPAELEVMMLDLVERDPPRLHVKIDRLSGMLRVGREDDKEVAYRTAMDACDQLLTKAKLVQWRGIIAQANIVLSQEKDGREKKRKTQTGGSSDENAGGRPAANQKGAIARTKAAVAAVAAAASSSTASVNNNNINNNNNNNNNNDDEEFGGESSQASSSAQVEFQPLEPIPRNLPAEPTQGAEPSQDVSSDVFVEEASAP